VIASFLRLSFLTVCTSSCACAARCATTLRAVVAKLTLLVALFCRLRLVACLFDCVIFKLEYWVTNQEFGEKRKSLLLLTILLALRLTLGFATALMQLCPDRETQKDQEMIRQMPEPEPEPQQDQDQQPPASITVLAGAMRRRRAARAPPESRATAVVNLQLCAAAASSAASQVLIRPLDATDITAVLLLNRDRLPGKVCTEALAIRLQSSAAHCLVAAAAPSTGSASDTAPQPVQGFVLCETSRGSADVVLLAVRSDCERQGVARALLSAALASAAAAGCTSASLSVRSGNAPALRLYHSLGFTAVGAPTIALQRVDGQGSGKASATTNSDQITMQWCL
jgi:ribosomal protein S18 acetylase RimI-like enzyme